MTIFTILAAATICGTVLGLFWPIPLWGAVLWATTGAIVSVRWRHPALLCLFAFGLGWARPPISHATLPDAPLAPCMRTVTGVITRSDPNLTGEQKLTITHPFLSTCISHHHPDSPLTPDSAPLFLTIKNPGDHPPLAGDTVLFTALVRPLLTPVNTPRWSLGKTKRPPLLARLPNQRYVHVNARPPSSLRTWRQHLRQAITRFWVNNAAPFGDLLCALTLGNKRMITPAHRNALIRSGTAHLMVVSGLHLATVTLLANLLLLAILRHIYVVAAQTDVTKIARVLCLVPVVGFTWFTGAAPPVLRACIMICAIVLGTLFHRPARPATALWAAALIIVLHDPAALVAPGVQLSFAAVAALTLFAQKATSTKPSRAASLPNADDERGNVLFKHVKTCTLKFTRWTTNLFFACCAAHAATMPILAIHFGQIPLLSPVNNLPTIPLVSLLLLPLGLTTALAGQLWPALAGLLIPFCHALTNLFTHLINWQSEHAILLHLTRPMDLLTTLLVAAGTAFVAASRWKIAIGAFLIAALVATLCRVPPIAPDTLTIDVLDVGQGDATLITFPNGTRWLVDGGGDARPHIGREVIGPTLKRLGVTKIHTMVLTHPDPDHTGGLAELINEFPVAAIWDNQQGIEEGAKKSYQQIIWLAKQKAIPIIATNQLCGTQKVGRVRVQVLHPCPKTGSYYPEYSFNDNSIVLRLSWGDNSILLTGDLGTAGERQLLKDGTLQQTTVLKLGHHGSTTSSTDLFLNKVNPTLAVASLGRFNRFGFVAQKIRDSLKKRHISLFRTDQHGHVRFTITPHHIYTRTYSETQKKP